MIDHSNKNCETLLASLSDFIDGELNSELCQEINQHLLECPECTIFIDTMKKTISLYRNPVNDSFTLTPEIKNRLYKRLNLVDFVK